MSVNKSAAICENRLTVTAPPPFSFGERMGCDEGGLHPLGERRGGYQKERDLERHGDTERENKQENKTKNLSTHYKADIHPRDNETQATVELNQFKTTGL